MEDEESEEETLKARHRKEKKELQAKVTKLKKQARNKKDKKEADERISELEKELEERQNQEIAALESKLAGLKTTHDEEEEVQERSATTEPQIPDGEEQTPDEVKKMTRAMKRRQKKLEEEKVRESQKEEEKASMGPSAREVESQKILQRISNQSLQVRDVKPDGHCLFRSVGVLLQKADLESLALTSESEDDIVWQLRKEVAGHMRVNIETYLPFAEDVSTEEEFDRYLEEVETTAAWGGQLEVLAIASVLKRKVIVYSADMEPLEMGDAEDSDPLRLSYHKQYYGLGEHYNAVVPVAVGEVAK